MIEQIRNEYWSEEGGREKICDVYQAIERAETLARTPMEKLHTKTACSVARRILETDPVFNPEHTATGHWNFFVRGIVQKKKECLTICHNYRWSFEWKRDSIIGDACEPVFYSDVYGILQEAVNCIWSSEWRVGASSLVEYMLWDTKPVKTRIICEDGGTVMTKAGTFNRCLMLSLNIEGLDGGLAYRGGMKKYYFADGIGIVRTENKYCCSAKTAVYELTAFQGTGEGYMPLADGMMHRFSHATN